MVRNPTTRDVQRIRLAAADMATAILVASADTHGPSTQTLHSLCSFFEKYICGGAEATRREFGPKKPSRLRVVKRDIGLHTSTQTSPR